ncbi:MAG: Hsp33 family molecular chaperone HslO [Kiloniellales bacterium]
MSESAGLTIPVDDLVQPFVIEQSGVRGRLLRLGAPVHTILTRPGYPRPVARLLAEMLALTGVLASTLKYDGVFTLQLKGEGPVRTMVADMTSDGMLRGYAGFDPAGVAELEAELGSVADAEEPLDVRRWLGKGHMAFTVDQGPHTQRYQGLVELSGPSLADCLLHYFRQSQQINAGILLAAAPPDSELGGTGWRASALLIERVPEAGGRQSPSDDLPEISGEDWNRALILTASCTRAELLDPALPPNTLLYRLFHEDGVRVFPPRPLSVGCRCSLDKVENILRSLGRDAIDEYKVEGEVVMTCEFCAQDFRFDEAALDRLYARQPKPDSQGDARDL